MADELSDFLADPNGETFLRLRALVEASPRYTMISDEDDQLAELIESGAYDQAAELAEQLMPNWLLSPRVHRLATTAAEQLGATETAARERYLERACTKGLLLAGDGTRERPYPVLHVADEYDLLDILAKEPVGQKVANGTDGPCDVITCEDGSEVWFSIASGLQNAVAQNR